MTEQGVLQRLLMAEAHLMFARAAFVCKDSKAIALASALAMKMLGEIDTVEMWPTTELALAVGPEVAVEAHHD
jgi:hypothetical protein